LFQTQYDALRSSLACEPAIFTYKPEYLHCTIATLASFKSLHLDASVPNSPSGSRIATAFTNALQKAFDATSDFPSPFSLIVEKPELHTAAGILRLSDPSGSLAAIRKCVSIAAHDEQLEAAGYDAEKGRFQVPDIIHSTFLRFGAQPSEPEEFRKLFNTVARYCSHYHIELLWLTVLQSMETISSAGVRTLSCMGDYAVYAYGEEIIKYHTYIPSVTAM